MERYGSQVDWIAERLQGRGVAALERLATALWVTRHSTKDASVDDRAAELQEIKRHVAPGDAIAAIKEIDEMLQAVP
jgi:DNA-binding ferritin-like protein